MGPSRAPARLQAWRWHCMAAVVSTALSPLLEHHRPGGRAEGLAGDRHPVAAVHQVYRAASTVPAEKITPTPPRASTRQSGTESQRRSLAWPLLPGFLGRAIIAH